MSRLSSLSALVSLVVSLVAGCAGPAVPFKRLAVHSAADGYSVDRNFIYTPHGWPEPIRGDFFLPRSRPSLMPAVLLIHGGGWSGGDGRWQMEPIAKQLTKRGYAVLNVTYRQAPRWTYPAPVEDLREALKWLREHAHEHGIDPNRIAAFGYSAGGYLAEMLAYTRGGEAGIAAVVAGGAPSNLAFYPGGDLVPQFLGGTRQEIPERFHEASPVNHLSPASPPTFLYQATGDRLVKPEHANASLAAMEALGVRHEIYWIHGKGHISGFLFPAAAVNRAIDFLDRELR